MEKCVICRENIDQNDQSNNIYTLPECGHKYHLECIMTWWRSPQDYCSSTVFGQCPLCRATPPTPISWRQHAGRVSFFKRMGRKKNIHPLLRTALDNLKKAEKRKDGIRKKLWKYRREHKNILKEIGRLSSKYWRAKVNVRNVGNELASFDPMGCYIEEDY